MVGVAALFLPVAFGQSVSALLGNKPADSADRAAVDSLGRATPRGAIFNFLQACHAERYVLAARYLDLRKIPPAERQTAGPERAKQLADILDREQGFEVERLSDSPEGNQNDGQTADSETLINLNVGGVPSSLTLQRIQWQGIQVWLVSDESVNRVADLDALESASPLEKRMPGVLVRNKILGTPLWIWFALAALTVLLILFSRALSRLFLLILAPVARRFAASLQAYRLQSLTDPLRLLISLVLFRVLMEFAAPSALLRDYLTKLLAFLFIFGMASLIVRIVDLTAIQVQSRLGPAERALSYSVLPLGVRVVRIAVFSMAALVLLASWGYNTNAILAGLGVGGLAVALAAQKTIENLFGGIALISDRPVLVGDYCSFGGQAGTVEDIGLRSTRIRTNDRTLVTIPNASFSNMTIENFSRRDRIWFHPTLHLHRDTSPEKLQEMLDASAAILRANPLVQPIDIPVRFTKIADSSLDLEIFAHIGTANYDEFLKVQTNLLLGFLNAGHRLGVAFALPIAESISVNPQDAGPSAKLNSHPSAAPPAALQRPG